MKKIFLTAIIFLLSMTTCAAQNPDFDAAELRLACAICSLGAYTNEDTHLMRSMITSNGWKIETFSQKTKRADTKVYLVSKGNTKILTIAGTEDLKDVEVDFRVSRVHIDGTPLNAAEKASNDVVFIHKGFRDYAELALSNGLDERLKTFLEQNPGETLYITGHSLGGAVATLAAIHLIDLGVNKNQIKVVTFGAPAVGSRAFAKIYEDKIDLTRIVMKGDFIKKSLGELGYVQFGKVVDYTPSHTSKHFEHKMIVYLDRAIRDYYDAGGDLRYESSDKLKAKIYVAPILLDKGDFYEDDKRFVSPVLDDDLSNHFRQIIFSDERIVELTDQEIVDKNFSEFAVPAKQHGCKYVLIRVLSAKKIRDSLSDEKRVTLEEFILDANGSLLTMQTSSASTKNLTILEAVLSAQNNLLEDTKNFFANR